jgi:SAM-dependent methyltransferase
MIERHMTELHSSFSSSGARDAALRRIEEFLDDAHPDWATDPRVIGQAAALSEGLTRGTRPAPGYVGAKASAAAYLAYFAPRAVAALAQVWEGMGDPDPGDVPIVDLGAGSGAASLFLQKRGATRLRLVDRDADALDLARRLLAPAPGFKFQVRDITREPGPPVDAEWVISTFALGEWGLPVEKAVQLLVTGAPPTQKLVLIDAGTRERSRYLQHFRQGVMEDGARIRSPCPHPEPCPALERERDYCHGVAERHLTPRLFQFAEATKRDPVRMAFSHLVVSRDSEKSTAEAVRVIGELRREKGRARLSVCGPGGMRFIQVLSRHKKAGKALSSLHRGALLEPDGLGELRGNTAHVDDPNALVSLNADVDPDRTEPS